MTDLMREVHFLISIAKVDARINEYKNELSTLPGKIKELEKSITVIAQNVEAAKSHFESLKKDHRGLEQKLEDHGVLIDKYKTQLMSIKTNKEYEAMTKEIKTLEQDVDAKEEKLLLLMDELDTQEKENTVYLEKATADKAENERKQKEMEGRVEFLKSELVKLEQEKPKFLEEIDPKLQKRYQRIIGKLGDYAVTNVVGDVCQGCFATTPPQTVNEVKKNDRIITCEACGRILVYYTS
jgi:predicted  nucleic acid-binding Zn-ribbon protein